MPNPLFPVPDWFSHENQGADIAIADLDGSGQPDLVVFMIDSPSGENQGFYRIGRNLDAAGTVTGAWSNWIPIPNWGSFENQGAGIALADLDNSGHQDLVVFQIDNPPGANRGLYRIGRNLDSTGKVTGGWSNWVVVPDWDCSENQGGGIALADLDNSGRSDLIVFQINNSAGDFGTYRPPGENLGLYRIARDLDTSGTPTRGWTPWMTVPNWLAQENQEGGITLADLNGSGHLDLVVFQIDNLTGQNNGLYRIGRDLQTSGYTYGSPAGGWGDWVSIPQLFSHENQGAGVAAAALDGTDRVDLVVFMIDSPSGCNQGFYSVLSPV